MGGVFLPISALVLGGSTLALTGQTVIYGLAAFGAGMWFKGLVNDLLESLIGLDGASYLHDLENALGDWILDQLISPLLQFLRDPLVLDLDGDGVELSSLAGSNVHFDYDRDGFAEKSGWVAADDGILAMDANNNGSVDGAGELFGSPSQDGFAVLETLDSNRDGKIDADDEDFAQLRVWRDLDQDGVSDAGELMTLEEAGITSISLMRTDVTGTNNGHDVGFEAEFTRADGTVGTAQTTYFETDRQDTRADNTPDFVVADGVALLPQLPGSGQINSVAWKASEDAGFRQEWMTLTDQAATLAPDELRTRFAELLLRWAGVDGLGENSRGGYVNAQHLVFVEKFFGSSYQEFQRKPRNRHTRIEARRNKTRLRRRVIPPTSVSQNPPDNQLLFLTLNHLVSTSIKWTLHAARHSTTKGARKFALTLDELRISPPRRNCPKSGCSMILHARPSRTSLPSGRSWARAMTCCVQVKATYSLARASPSGWPFKSSSHAIIFSVGLMTTRSNPRPLDRPNVSFGGKADATFNVGSPSRLYQSTGREIESQLLASDDVEPCIRRAGLSEIGTIVIEPTRN